MSVVNNAALMAGAPDPRSHLDEKATAVQIQYNDMVDKTRNKQPLEVYEHYAAIEREKEDNAVFDESESGSPYTKLYRKLFSKKIDINNSAIVKVDSKSVDDDSATDSNHSAKGEKLAMYPAHKVITAEGQVSRTERETAYFALRTASWQGVFFLITTDILGPSTAPYAFSQLGYAGGLLGYTLLFILAVLGGQALYRLYCRMDSSRYPVRNYADIAERLFGRTAKHICNILQSLQLVLNVGLLTLGSAQTLAVVIQYKFCFSALNVLFMVSGILLGQIKSLKNFAWLANLAVWLNVLVIILTMVGVPVFGPVPTLNGFTAPFADVVTTALAPIGDNWYLQVVGLQNAIFAYGGAMIFVEFMAEMRRPKDFYKAALLAQTFIYVVYVMYGAVIYHYSGQYSYIVSSLGINNYAFVTITNVVGLVSGMIAAVLYGNIGVKVIYINVLQEYFKAPDLGSGRGRWLWVVSVFFYWAFAFIVASAIPNLAAMGTLVGAFCILQFTYTFPPIMYCAYMFQRDASSAEPNWTPEMVPFSNRIDSWRHSSRWYRGFKKQWYVKLILITLFLASCALWGLGSYAGIQAIIDTFASGSAVAFSCRSPGQPIDSPTPI